MTTDVEPGKFRSVLGHFPTGVAVVTGIDADGKPAGMAVGSFSSVSLDPPLVAFMPDKSSSSWPKFRDSGSFCVNILGAEQESVCRTFASRGGDKFAELSWRPAGSGAPVLDGRGYLRIVGRIKDMFIVGGFNVYPAEVEQVLARLDGVAESAVIGVAEPRLGEVGKAFVVARPGESVDPDEVVAFCREHMANYKVPRSVEVVDALPRNASGKVLKFELRDKAVAT